MKALSRAWKVLKKAHERGELFETRLRLKDRLITKFYTILQSWRFSHFGKGATIQRHCTLQRPDAISIGANVRIGKFVWLNAANWREDERPSLIIGQGTYISNF